MDFVIPEMRALSDNYYGWAKEVYEHLGFVFAVGKVNAAAVLEYAGILLTPEHGDRRQIRESGTAAAERPGSHRWPARDRCGQL